MTNAPLLYVVAAESSGDHLGAALIENIRKEQGLNVRFCGIGGPAMDAAGVPSLFDISPLSILGIVEGLKSYPMIMTLVNAAVDDILERNPDMVVLIDSWGFMMRVAERLKKRGFAGQIVKYVAPQVWAMREGRTKVLAKSVDHLLTIHSFDAPYFEREGLPVTYIGNPVFDTDYRQGNAQRLRNTYNIPKDAPVLIVLFGSRLSEIQRLNQPFSDAIEILQRDIPDLVCIAPVADTIATDIRAAAGADMRLQSVIFLDEKDKFDAFACATAALACSGTVTTQLACAGIPTTLAYKLGGLSWAVAKRLYKPDYVAIVNIAAGQELMPEHLQSEANGPALAASVKPYLTEPQIRQKASEGLLKQTDIMRGEGGVASVRAASAIINLLGL